MDMFVDLRVLNRPLQFINNTSGLAKKNSKGQ